MMRSLTVKQAQACETATRPRCECRCGGRLHGAGRAVTREQLSELPLDDPHYRPSLNRRAALQKLNRIICAAAREVGAGGHLGDRYRLLEDLIATSVLCKGQIRRRDDGNSSAASSV